MVSTWEGFFSHTFFPSDPRSGKIGSIEFNLWMAQVSGVPVVGLKRESVTVQALLLCYGIPMLVAVAFLYTGFELYDLWLKWPDLNSLTQNICLSFTHFAGIFKTINTFYRWRDIKNVLLQLQEITKTYVLTAEQSKVFHRGEFENKMSLMIYGSLVGITGAMGIVILYYTPQNAIGQFPFCVFLPAWMPYELQLLYMGGSVLLMALQIVAIDYLNINIMNQIRFQFKVLNLTFAGLLVVEAEKSTPKMEKDAIVPNEEPNKLLQKVIDHHCGLIQLRKEVESIFRMPLLIQFFTSLVIFAMTGFQATVRANDSNGAVLIYFYCGCIFCELFFYCWFGNAVSEQSKTLATSGYSCAWYLLDKSFKQSLTIFIINSQRPYLFTAGGFMSLSLPSFAGILSKSYSYIAVLRQIYS